MRIPPRLCATIAAAATAACAHPAPPLSSTKLVVQSSRGGVVAFVNATVAGEPTMLLVDTGATQSTLPASFARAHELRIGRRASAEELVDANGVRVTMRRLPDVPVQFDGEPTGGTMEFLMNPAASGDVGILAPQSLLRRGWALVIDLEREELRHEPEEAALARMRGAGVALRELDYGGCLDEGFFERSHRFVVATVNGVSSKMLVDTGASRTALTRNNPALRTMIGRTGDRASATGVASVGASLLVEDVPIVFADTSFTVAALVLPSSPRCGHGALGADILRHCTLVWGWSKLWGTCRAPVAER